jgi:hypothetical protein
MAHVGLWRLLRREVHPGTEISGEEDRAVTMTEGFVVGPMIQSHAIWTYVKPTVDGKFAKLSGESLGSSAEEGRVKLR